MSRIKAFFCLGSNGFRSPPAQSDIIMPLAKDGYMCIRSSSTCLVYLPQEVKEKLTITTVTDTSIRPKLANNEILIAPVVCITTENPSLLLRKPAVVELKKIIELSDSEANNKVILLCANSESLEWKELGAECECRVLKDRVSFKVTHFSLYAVISRKPRASSTVRVKPASADTPTPDRSSTSPTELTIPELPGFKVQIPPFSVNANRETDITATILHDCLSVCSEDDRSRLASSCVELIPHDITFSKPVSISIPIPDYVQVKESHPNAKLQIWHTNKQHNGSPDQLDWNLVEHSISQDEEGRYVAIVSTEHFSWYKPLWDVCAWACSRFATSFGIQERCQVFMSQETRLQPSQNITFSIAVVFYPYKEDPEPLPCNYKYTLLDSGLLDLSVSNEDALQFVVELNEQLLPNTHKPITGSFVISSHQARHQKACMVSLDGKVELQPGLPIGGLTFGIKEKPEDTHQTLILMKPIEQAQAAARSTLEFENTIMTAAKKLRADAIEYEFSPIVETAKTIASMWLEMAHLIRKDCGPAGDGSLKESIVDLAKRINKESQEVVRVATSTAEVCTDGIMKKDVYGVVERVDMISHQLKILATQETTKQRDERSDFEACQMLTDNAKNLSSAISEALYHTQSASIRVSKETREELGLTRTGSTKETLPGCLNPNDLQRVQNTIWEARAQWYNLGLGLDITADSLDVIELANMGKPDRCFRAMLTQWLREHCKPSWSTLADALRSPSVGLCHLAEQIILQ